MYATLSHNDGSLEIRTDQFRVRLVRDNVKELFLLLDYFKEDIMYVEGPDE